jgi:outer membrane immunogenic protein
MAYEHRLHLARLGLNYRFWQPANMGTVVAASATTTPYSWTGFYIGLNAGVGVSGTTVANAEQFNNGFFDMYDVGFTGGGQVGFNWQAAPSWIVGIEGDIGFLNTSRRFCVINNNCGSAAAFTIHTSEADFVSTLRARAGFVAWQRGLLYVTGGAAWVRVKNSWTDQGTVNQKSTTLSGWTAGGGLEAAVAGNWTVKAEYLYIDVGSHSVADADGNTDPDFLPFDYKHRFHLARLGLNYRFGN